MEKDNTNGKSTMTWLRIGDEIDNRGGLLIKHIEHYHASEDPFKCMNKHEDVTLYHEKNLSLIPEMKDELLEDKFTQKLNENVVTPLDRIYRGIQYVKDSGVVKNDYEYVAIRKYIDELNIGFDNLGYNDFVSLLKDSGAFSEDTCPKASNMSKISITGAYPNWKVVGKKYDVLKNLLEVVRVFIEGCKNV